jgi:hypothetical protein
MFQILTETHQKYGHKGRDAFYKLVKQQSASITKDFCQSFVLCCCPEAASIRDGQFGNGWLSPVLPDNPLQLAPTAHQFSDPSSATSEDIADARYFADLAASLSAGLEAMGSTMSEQSSPMTAAQEIEDEPQFDLGIYFDADLSSEQSSPLTAAQEIEDEPQFDLGIYFDADFSNFDHFKGVNSGNC